MSDLKINIQSMNDRNVIQEKPFPNLNDQTPLIRSFGGVSASDDVKIVFNISAVKVLFKHISWGKKFRRGDVEQAGVLIGKYYKDSTSGNSVVWGEVTTVIPAATELVRASFENVSITTEAWAKMYEDADEYIRKGMQVIGWYHTHLDNINTRFSALDRSTQKQAFTFDYSFGVVLNPNQKKWSVFYGPNSVECRGILILDDEVSEIDSNPLIRIKQVNGDSFIEEDGKVVHLDENGKPISVQNTTVDECEEDEETLSSLMGQFFIGVGGLLNKKKRKRKSVSENRKNNSVSRLEYTASRTTQTNLTREEHSPSVERGESLRIKRDSSPKIEILKSNEDERMTVRFTYFTSLVNGELRSVPDWKLIVSKETIRNIFVLMNDSNKQYIYGRLSCSDMHISLVISKKEEANCLLMSGKDLGRENKLQTIVFGMYSVLRKEKLDKLVIVEELRTNSVDVKLIHYSKGDTV